MKVKNFLDVNTVPRNMKHQDVGFTAAFGDAAGSSECGRRVNIKGMPCSLASLLCFGPCMCGVCMWAGTKENTGFHPRVNTSLLLYVSALLPRDRVSHWKRSLWLSHWLGGQEASVTFSLWGSRCMWPRPLLHECWTLEHRPSSTPTPVPSPCPGFIYLFVYLGFCFAGGHYVSPIWLQTHQPSSCLSLQNAGTTGMYHHLSCLAFYLDAFFHSVSD